MPSQAARGRRGGVHPAIFDCTREQKCMKFALILEIYILHITTPYGALHICMRVFSRGHDDQMPNFHRYNIVQGCMLFHGERMVD